jgi:DNA repair exonuclease SbcCD ATPase subunit
VDDVRVAECEKRLADTNLKLDNLAVEHKAQLADMRAVLEKKDRELERMHTSRKLMVQSEERLKRLSAAVDELTESLRISEGRLVVMRGDREHALATAEETRQKLEATVDKLNITEEKLDATEEKLDAVKREIKDLKRNPAQGPVPSPSQGSAPRPSADPALRAKVAALEQRNRDLSASLVQTQTELTQARAAEAQKSKTIDGLRKQVKSAEADAEKSEDAAIRAMDKLEALEEKLKKKSRSAKPFRAQAGHRYHEPGCHHADGLYSRSLKWVLEHCTGPCQKCLA